MTQAALPEDVLLELHVPRTGERYQVAQDGRFVVNEKQQQPLSKSEPGAQVVSPSGLDRLRAALEEADFFALPDDVPMNDCVPEGAVLPNSGRKVTSQPLVFSARREGEARTVTVTGDPAFPCTLGPLQPVYRALDLEALGDWMNE